MAKQKKDGGGGNKAYIAWPTDTPISPAASGERDKYDIEVMVGLSGKKPSDAVPCKIAVQEGVLPGIYDVKDQQTISLPGIKLNLNQPEIVIEIFRAGQPEADDSVKITPKEIRASVSSKQAQIDNLLKVETKLPKPDGRSKVMLTTLDPTSKQPAKGHVVITLKQAFRINGNSFGPGSQTLETENDGKLEFEVELTIDKEVALFEYLEGKCKVKRLILMKTP